jgi:hypothetical protein
VAHADEVGHEWIGLELELLDGVDATGRRLGGLGLRDGLVTQVGRHSVFPLLRTVGLVRLHQKPNVV